jgi:hypothetical protein
MKWFRNSRDLIKEYRDAAIARANAMEDEEESSSPAEPYLTSFTASSQNELSSQVILRIKNLSRQYTAPYGPTDQKDQPCRGIRDIE